MRLTPLVALVVAAASACSVSSLDGYSVGGADSGTIDAGLDARLDAPGDGSNPLDQGAPDAAPDAIPDVVVPPPCNLAAPFGALAPLSSLNTSVVDGQAILSPDELTVLFESNRLGGPLQVFTAARPNKGAAFGSVAPLASLNFGGADTWNVTLTGDALTAYLVTDQNAANNMYVATRASSLAGFGSPKLMPLPIRSGGQPFVTPDGKILYYTDATGPKSKIMRAVLGSSPTVTTVALGVPAGHDLAIAVINPTETLIYFALFDAATFASYDIWTATRATPGDPWGTPSAVSELNTAGFEVPSWVSADGCSLYVTRADSTGNDWEMYVAHKP